MEATHEAANSAQALAEQIEWTPLRRGGANFGTHRLVRVGPDRLEFRATIGAIVFAYLFILAGAGCYRRRSSSRPRAPSRFRWESPA